MVTLVADGVLCNLKIPNVANTVYMYVKLLLTFFFVLEITLSTILEIVKFMTLGLT